MPVAVTERLEDFDYKLILHPKREAGEDMAVQEVSILDDIDLKDWFPVERWKVDKYIRDAFQENSDGSLWGIKHPVRLFEIDKRKKEKPIGDGFHRVATQFVIVARAYGILPPEFPAFFNFEEALPQILPQLREIAKKDPLAFMIPATIMKNASNKDLWNERTSALIGQHKNVRFTRFVQLFVQQWPEDWMDLPDALRLAQGLQSDRIMKSKKVQSKAVQDLLQRSEDWGVSIATLRDYIDLSEKLHQALISKVRIEAARDELSESQARLLVKYFPDKYRDWQFVIYDLMRRNEIKRDATYELDDVCKYVRALAVFYQPRNEFSQTDLTLQVVAGLDGKTQEEKVAFEKVIYIITSAFTKLYFASWWKDQPAVRQLAIDIFRKTRNDNLNDIDVETISNTVTELFTRSVTGKPEKEFLRSDEITPALEKARRFIATYVSALDTKKVVLAPQQVVYDRKKLSNKEVPITGTAAEIIHLLINSAILQYKMSQKSSGAATKSRGKEKPELQQVFSRLGELSEVQLYTGKQAAEILKLVKEMDRLLKLADPSSL